MQLKYRLFWILMIICIQAFAQKSVELINGKNLYNNIYEAAYQQIDELQKINENGMLLIKIDMLDGKIQQIAFSSEQPVQLVKLLRTTLQESTLKLIKSSALTSIIIPISYHYKTSLTTSASDLMSQIPTVDVNKLPSPKFQNDFDQFLGITTTDDKVFGISCLFFPLIRLNGKIQ